MSGVSSAGCTTRRGSEFTANANHAAQKSSVLLDYYESMVRSGSLREDIHQRSVLLQLEQLQGVIRVYDNTPRFKVSDRDIKVNRQRHVEDSKASDAKHKTQVTEAEQVG